MTESTKSKLRWGGLILVVLLIVGFIGFSEIRFNKKINQDIDNYRAETIGVVYSFKYGGKSVAKTLIYEYFVMVSKGGGALVVKERFTGGIGDSQAPELLTECKKQNCPNCIGAKFKVEYSTKNPHYSRIIIGNDTIARGWRLFEW
jgi:hypothetical protein